MVKPPRLSENARGERAHARAQRALRKTWPRGGGFKSRDDSILSAIVFRVDDAPHLLA